MTETAAAETTAMVMTTIAAQRIIERAGELTFDQVKAAFTAAVSMLDGEAAEEVGSGGYFDGPALSTLNAMAEAAGLARFNPEDFASEEDFFFEPL
ncbi:hypothetical protein MUY14_43165 [Amycolatopsis sp. FBCC-B4732]|uniref:hypothetical protein n=1 Tax=Amycolatopsis sp. FBCC-B4732 TaxID=3079339 RepID=UPI001FF505C2|nr:hypothetical protein [Amycolatopsis sp. FBCC-B4732]UOX88412.1 hypothetical protein MUY14_43165 [Amycolatopsis sp. FBCC-B4732]